MDEDNVERKMAHREKSKCVNKGVIANNDQIVIHNSLEDTNSPVVHWE